MTRIKDTEWTEAQNADERPVFYRCEMPNGGHCIKFYKPSVAALVIKRINTKLSPVLSSSNSETN